MHHFSPPEAIFFPAFFHREIKAPSNRVSPPEPVFMRLQKDDPLLPYARRAPFLHLAAKIFLKKCKKTIDHGTDSLQYLPPATKRVTEREAQFGRTGRSPFAGYPQETPENQNDENFDTETVF
jgi:hypothetical protein